MTMLLPVWVAPSERNNFVTLRTEVGGRYTDVSDEAKAQIEGATSLAELIAGLKTARNALQEKQAAARIARDFIERDCMACRVQYLTAHLSELEKMSPDELIYQ